MSPRAAEAVMAAVAVVLTNVHAAAAHEDSCLASGAVAGICVACILATLICCVLAFLLWRWRTQGGGRLGGVRKARSITDPEADVPYVYDNPHFQDDDPEKGFGIPSEKKPDKGNAGMNGWSDAGKQGHKIYFHNGKLRTQDDADLAKRGKEIKQVPLRSHDFTGLGFNIIGNMREGIFVKNVQGRGPAYESGKIHQGDRILSMTVSFASMVYEDALTILSYASPYDVRLTIQKGGSSSISSSSSSAAAPASAGVGGGPGVREGPLDHTDGPAHLRKLHPLFRSQSSADIREPSPGLQEHHGHPGLQTSGSGGVRHPHRTKGDPAAIHYRPPALVPSQVPAPQPSVQKNGGQVHSQQTRAAAKQPDPGRRLPEYVPAYDLVELAEQRAREKGQLVGDKVVDESAKKADKQEKKSKKEKEKPKKDKEKKVKSADSSPEKEAKGASLLLKPTFFSSDKKEKSTEEKKNEKAADDKKEKNADAKKKEKHAGDKKKDKDIDGKKKKKSRSRSDGRSSSSEREASADGKERKQKKKAPSPPAVAKESEKVQQKDASALGVLKKDSKKRKSSRKEKQEKSKTGKDDEIKRTSSSSSLSSSSSEDDSAKKPAALTAKKSPRESTDGSAALIAGDAAKTTNISPKTSANVKDPYANLSPEDRLDVIRLSYEDENAMYDSKLKSKDEISLSSSSDEEDASGKKKVKPLVEPPSNSVTIDIESKNVEPRASASSPENISSVDKIRHRSSSMSSSASSHSSGKPKAASVSILVDNSPESGAAAPAAEQDLSWTYPTPAPVAVEPSEDDAWQYKLPPTAQSTPLAAAADEPTRKRNEMTIHLSAPRRGSQEEGGSSGGGDQQQQERKFDLLAEIESEITTPRPRTPSSSASSRSSSRSAARPEDSSEVFSTPAEHPKVFLSSQAAAENRNGASFSSPDDTVVPAHETPTSKAKAPEVFILSEEELEAASGMTSPYKVLESYRSHQSEPEPQNASQSSKEEKLAQPRSRTSSTLSSSSSSSSSSDDSGGGPTKEDMPELVAAGAVEDLPRNNGELQEAAVGADTDESGGGAAYSYRRQVTEITVDADTGATTTTTTTTANRTFYSEGVEENGGDGEEEEDEADVPEGLDPHQYQQYLQFQQQLLKQQEQLSRMGLPVPGVTAAAIDGPGENGSATTAADDRY